MWMNLPLQILISTPAPSERQELAAYLQHLIETPEDYEAYFAWRSKPLPDSIVKRLPGLETPTFLPIDESRASTPGKSGRIRHPDGRLFLSAASPSYAPGCAAGRKRSRADD